MVMTDVVSLESADRVSRTPVKVEVRFVKFESEIVRLIELAEYRKIPE